MAQFHVKRAFELPEESAFVLAGSIIEGEIRAGMFMDFCSGVSCLRGPIDSIQFQKSGGPEGVWLIFNEDSDDLALWRLLNIQDEIMNVFEMRLISGLD